MKPKGLWIALAAVVVGLVGGCGKEEIPRPEVLRLGEEHLDRGNAYIGENEYDKAIEEYTKVIRLETNSAEKMIKVQAYWGRANLYLIRDIDEIIELYDRVGPYLEKGELDKAIEEYSKTISLEARRGKKLIGMAIEDFGKAISLNTNGPGAQQAYSLRGRVYCGLGEIDKGIKDYSEAIRVAPDFGLAYEERAWAYAAKGEDEKAAADFGKAEELDGRPVDRSATFFFFPSIARNEMLASACIQRGHLYLEKGERDRAIEDFSKAISLNPNDPEAYADRAKAYAAKGEIKKTADDLRKLKERWPDYPLNE